MEKLRELVKYENLGNEQKIRYIKDMFRLSHGKGKRKGKKKAKNK